LRPRSVRGVLPAGVIVADMPRSAGILQLSSHFKLKHGSTFTIAHFQNG
jgi:hypothetical protein